MKNPLHCGDRFHSFRQKQRGAAAVEFALIALVAFFPLLLGIVEFGRLFYVANSVQEVTRRAAREQVVAWTGDTNRIQREAVFQPGNGTGTVSLPAGAEIHNSDVRLSFYNTYADALSGSNAIGVSTPEANWESCLRGETSCIRYVRASLETAGGGPLMYTPMIDWFGNLFAIPLPGATLIMPAEALGLA